LKTVMERGKLLCGGNANVPGFGYLDPATQQFAGFDIDFCKAIAAAIFDDPARKGREGLDFFVARAVRRALNTVASEHGTWADDWRWGKSHQMSVRGALYSAPVIGFLFDTWSREEAGIETAPRAEGPDFGKRLRVRHGAGLRLIAELKRDGAEVRMINDSGQSGHFGHRHIDDQLPKWSAGEPVKLARSKKELVEIREGALDLLPR
jgi:acyl-homoserine lactone acylase PvdQ